MKKLICFVAALMALAALVVPASARSNAQQMEYTAQVGTDGGCDVTVHAQMVFDETVTDPEFPVPLEAVDITLNGTAVETVKSDRARMISLGGITGGVPGNYSITITYRVERIAQTQKDGTMLLTMPLLSGLGYPVDALSVSVTLPEEIKSEPSFISGYYQEHTDKLLKTTVSGNTITISSQQVLLDHETLTMTLQVEQSMFPKTAAKARVLGMMDIAVIVSVVLACVYFVLTMWPALPKIKKQSVAPDAVTAGELPVWFVGAKTDLSMLVISWAQLGYLRIELTADGRVLLHKRMEMGNERSNFENRCFKNLFGRRRTLDAGSDHYARMVRMAEKKGNRKKDVYYRKTGNPGIFRGLCGLAALFSGVNLAGGLGIEGSFARLVMACAVAVLAWMIQGGVSGLLLRKKGRLLLGTICLAVWIGLGMAAGQWLVTVLMAAFQILAGGAVCFGGKRTELGKQALSQILGMRKFMTSADKGELQKLLKANPGYFYEMAPYALALGVDRGFAARFGRLRIGECGYLTAGDGMMMASQWAALLRKVVRIMDAKSARMMPWQR